MLSHSYSVLLLLLLTHQIHCNSRSGTAGLAQEESTQKQSTNEKGSTSNKQTQKTEHNGSSSGHNGESDAGNPYRESAYGGSEDGKSQGGSVRLEKSQGGSDRLGKSQDGNPYGESAYGGSEAPYSNRGSSDKQTQKTEHNGSNSGHNGGSDAGNPYRESAYGGSEAPYRDGDRGSKVMEIGSTSNKQTQKTEHNGSSPGHNGGSEAPYRDIQKESEEGGSQKATKKKVTFDLPKSKKVDLKNLEGNATLADFDVKESIGEGNYGSVFKAYKKNASGTGKDDKDKTVYAMKIVDWSDAIDHRYPEVIAREVNILFNLDHPFIAKLHWYFWSQSPEEWLARRGMDAYWPENTYLFMVMDYYEGGDLLSLQDAIISTREKEGIENVFSFTEAQVRFYVAQMILVLKCLQDENIAHRDIKPENILVDKQGYIKLADFGLAKDESKFNVSTNVVGSPDYMAPELAKILLSNEHADNPQTYTKAVDLWSLGATAFKLLFVQMPFKGKDKRALYINKIESQLVIPSKIANQQVSNEFKDLLKGLMAPDPNNRLGNRVKYRNAFENKQSNLPAWISKIASLWRGPNAENEAMKKTDDTQISHWSEDDQKKPRENGMLELLNHQWFKIPLGDSPPIDWEQLMSKKSPYVPYVLTEDKDHFRFRDNHKKGFGINEVQNKKTYEKKPEMIQSHRSPRRG